jgi:hypothetical protein
MPELRVSITRYVSDEPQPGTVECELVDANGRRWIFIEKTAIVTGASLNAETSYPRPGRIACEILSSRADAAGRTILLVDTERPAGVESVDGETRFEVLSEVVAA